MFTSAETLPINYFVKGKSSQNIFLLHKIEKIFLSVKFLILSVTNPQTIKNEKDFCLKFHLNSHLINPFTDPFQTLYTKADHLMAIFSTGEGQSGLCLHMRCSNRFERLQMQLNLPLTAGRFK